MYIKFKGQIKINDNRESDITESDVLDYINDSIIFAKSDKEAVDNLNLKWEIVENYDNSSS
jgi:hypothetical protein